MAIAALDIGGTNIKHCLFQSDGDFTSTSIHTTPSQAKQGTQALLGRIFAILDEMKEHGFDAIGVSTAGQVNPESGEIIHATEHIPGYTGTKLGQILSQRYGVPVTVENDVNAAMTGEVCCRPGEKAGVILGLTYGTGIGGCIFLDREIYRGRDYAAAEFGHMVIHGGDGYPCVCGQRGCYEAHAATSALLRRAKEELGESLNGRELVARMEEKPIAGLLDSWLEDVTYGLATLAYVFYPSRLILGGGIMENGFLIREAERRLRDRLLPKYRNTTVEGTHFGNGAGLRGAIYLAQERMARG